MKKEVKGFIVGVTTAIFAVSGMAYAKTGSEMIEAAYNNVKIYIDGLLLDPKDPNGDTVEPFVSNGTTYLPVRAVADAFGKEVDWDGETSSVIIGERDYDWLDQMSVFDTNLSDNDNKVSPFSSYKMKDGVNYDRGLYFYIDEYSGDENGERYADVSYLLNGQYKSLEGIIAAYYDDIVGGIASIKVYGDGELLYTSPIISEGLKSTDVKVDISDVNVLKISAALESNSSGSHGPCLAEARVLKK